MRFFLDKKSDLRVRIAGLADKEFIIQANLRMAKETENLDLDISVLRAGVDSVFAEPQYAFYLVAELRGEVVGCLMITYEWSDWRNKRVAWIQSLFVEPNARRQGVYRQLFSYLEEQVKTGVFCGLRLYVDRTNTLAQQVYKNLGMTDNHYITFEKMAKG